MDVESPYAAGGIDNMGPALADLAHLASGLLHDPIFLALLGCALIALLVTNGPTFRDPPHDPWPPRPKTKR